METMTMSEWKKRVENSHAHRRTCTYEEARREEEELREAYKTIVPEVGERCTQILWSDKYCYTITKIYGNNKIGIRENEYRVKNLYNGEAEILDTLAGDEIIITRRKSGRWRELGAPDKSGEALYTLAYARTYIDPCF